MTEEGNLLFYKFMSDSLLFSIIWVGNNRSSYLKYKTKWSLEFLKKKYKYNTTKKHNHNVVLNKKQLRIKFLINRDPKSLIKRDRDFKFPTYKDSYRLFNTSSIPKTVALSLKSI